MKLARFLNYFARVVSMNTKDPTVCFYVGEEEVQVRSVSYDVEACVWKVQLTERKT